MSFRPADNTLFAWLDGPDSAHTINLATGAATLVGNSGISTAGGALAFSPGNTLFFANFNGAQLHTINQTTGLPTQVATLTGQGGRLNAMDFQPGTGVLFAIDNRSPPGTRGSGPNFLTTINTSTGVVTPIGQTQNGMDALAWCNTAPAITPMAQTIAPGSSQTLQIATVSDAEDAENLLTVMVTTANPSNGVTLSNIAVDAAGIVSADVTVAGSPCSAATATFDLKVTDTSGLMATATETMTVNVPVINVNPATLPNTSAGAAYNQTVSATPGGTTYSFTVTGGSLPVGLSLNTASGAITGTATVAGNYGFTITATGFGTCTGSRNYTLQVTACTTTITVNPATLPGGTVGTAYPATTITATPAGTYTFGVSGSLPPGLSLDPNTGGLSGTPTTSGLFSFTITATNAGGCKGSRSYSRVSIACPTVTFNPAGPALPSATVGVNYNQTIGVTPGTGYTFSIIQGNLPPGMTLNPTTGALTGPPTAPGNYSFTIRAALGNCGPTKAYTLTIAAAALSTRPASRRSR